MRIYTEFIIAKEAEKGKSRSELSGKREKPQ